MGDTELEFPSQLVQALRRTRAVAVLTGSGVSAESGVATFRDALTGLWSKFDPDELATPEGFRRDPQVVWDWYADRRRLMRTVEPNAGHRALAEMERHIAQFSLITQNIDGLHRRAGSRQVIELHGNIMRVKCFKEGTVVDSWPQDGERPPRCPRCGSYLRPDVVWFGELLPEQALRAAREAARTCDIFLSIGTSGVVEPAASIPLEARTAGAIVVEVNPDSTPLSRLATFRLAGPSGEVLPRLVNTVWPRAGRH